MPKDCLLHHKKLKQFVLLATILVHFDPTKELIVSADASPYGIPYHPSSNSLAKRAVQTFKNGISKLDGPVDKRMAHFLFQYRITPQSSTGISPAELLMGRRLHCKLDLLHPDIPKRVIQQQDKMITRSGRKVLRSFKEGERLYAKSFQSHQKWIPVTVVKQTGPVSYKVKLSDGRIQRRHIDHLRVRYNEDVNQDEDWPMHITKCFTTITTSTTTTTATTTMTLNS